MLPVCTKFFISPLLGLIGKKSNINKATKMGHWESDTMLPKPIHLKKSPINTSHAAAEIRQRATQREKESQTKNILLSPSTHIISCISQDLSGREKILQKTEMQERWMQLRELCICHLFVWLLVVVFFHYLMKIAFLQTEALQNSLKICFPTATEEYISF